MTGFDTERDALWTARAKRLLEEAICLAGTEDVIPLVSGAEACLRIAMGEPCTCPPALRARGGHSGSCRAHALVVSP